MYMCCKGFWIDLPSLTDQEAQRIDNLKNQGHILQSKKLTKQSIVFIDSQGESKPATGSGTDGSKGKNQSTSSKSKKIKDYQEKKANSENAPADKAMVEENKASIETEDELPSEDT